jgi:hypothetical protein
MAHRSTKLALFFVSVSLLIATGANAEEQTRPIPADPLVFGSNDEYEIRFDDDPLAALPNDVIVPRIHVRGTIGSPRLTRPRTQFVVELLKTAEAI